MNKPEKLLVWVKICCYRVGVQPGPESTNVQLIHGGDLLKKGSSTWPDPCVVPADIDRVLVHLLSVMARGIPWRLLSIQLKVVNILQVRRYAVVCCVDQCLVQIHQQHQLPIQ